MSSTSAALARTHAVSPVSTATSWMSVGKRRRRPVATWPSRCRPPVSAGRVSLFRRGEQRAADPARVFRACCRTPRRKPAQLRDRYCELLALASGDPPGPRPRALAPSRPISRGRMSTDAVLTARTPRRPGRRSTFAPVEWRSIAGMAGFVVLLHLVGWGVLVFAVAPQEYHLGSTGVLGVG